MNNDIWVFDTETLTANNDYFRKYKKTHVWAWAGVNLNDLDNILYGTSITHLLNWCEKDLSGANKTIYFHNLKWDSQFVFSALEKRGFTWTPTNKNMKSKTYTALITEMGQYFSLEICFYRSGKKIKRVTLLRYVKPPL